MPFILYKLLFRRDNFQGGATTIGAKYETGTPKDKMPRGQSVLNQMSLPFLFLVQLFLLVQ
jgi:hypothetical protein